MEKEDIILCLLKEVREAQKETDNKVDDLKNGVVSEDRCQQYRDCFEDRLRDVESKCSTLMIDRENKIDGEDLLIAKHDVINATKTDIDVMNKRIDAINDKLKLLDLTWSTVKNNPVLLTAFIGGAMMFVGIFSGRGYDLIQIYDTHTVVIGAFIVIVGLFSVWLTRHRAKKALKKVGINLVM